MPNSSNTTLKKKQRRGAFTLKNKNAENFIKKVMTNNAVNDPGDLGRGSPISETGSEPRTPNARAPSPINMSPPSPPLITRSLALIPKRRVRFTNNTKINNKKNTRGLVKNITLESAPYLNQNISYENLSPNNQYARNLSNARLSMPQVSRKGKRLISQELAPYYAALIANSVKRGSSTTMKNVQTIVEQNNRLTRSQKNKLLHKVKFNFGK